MNEDQLLWLHFQFAALPPDILEGILAKRVSIRKCVEVMAYSWRDSEEATPKTVALMDGILDNLDEAAQHAAGVLGLT